MNYLKYIEHAAENLQFFLWFRDYSARWQNLPASEKALAPEWTRTQAEAEAAGNISNRPKRVNPQVAAVLKDTDFADGPPKRLVDRADPFNTPLKTPEDEKRDMMSDYGSSTDETSFGSDRTHRSLAQKAFDDAGMKWKPCESDLNVVVYTSSGC